MPHQSGFTKNRDLRKDIHEIDQIVAEEVSAWHQLYIQMLSNMGDTIHLFYLFFV